MDYKLEDWIDECIANGTFKDREYAIEFCVGATKLYCEVGKLTRETLVKHTAGTIDYRGKAVSFPIDWDWLRETTVMGWKDTLENWDNRHKSLDDMGKHISTPGNKADTKRLVKIFDY